MLENPYEYEEEHAQEQAAHWVKLIWNVGCAISIGILAALLWPTISRADDVKVLGTVENPQGTRITLLDAPCDSPQVAALISGNLPEEMHAGWRKLDAVFAMKGTNEIQRFEGCYLEVSGQVLLVFSDGDHFMLPRSAFKRTGVDA